MLWRMYIVYCLCTMIYEKWKGLENEKGNWMDKSVIGKKRGKGEIGQ